MRKINRKALSPVVASIILIAVIVSVSIAVAAWMGVLFFTFTNTEQVQITNISFGSSGSNSWIAVVVNNTGNYAVTINEVWLNGVKKTETYSPLPISISSNSGNVMNITTSVVSKSTYIINLVSSKGNQFQYSASAP